MVRLLRWTCPVGMSIRGKSIPMSKTVLSFVGSTKPPPWEEAGNPEVRGNAGPEPVMFREAVTPIVTCR